MGEVAGAREFFVLLAGGAACAFALTLSSSACVKFSPEVKQTFEPQTAKEHSNFEPRPPPYGPIYVGPLAVPSSLPADAGVDAPVDAFAPPFELDAAPTPPVPLEAGVL
jgi:hypothetical protein